MQLVYGVLALHILRNLFMRLQTALGTWFRLEGIIVLGTIICSSEGILGTIWWGLKFALLVFPMTIIINTKISYIKNAFQHEAIYVIKGTKKLASLYFIPMIAAFFL